MSEYIKQGEEFLKDTNSIILVKWNSYDRYFPSDTEKRDIWDFIIKRGERQYVGKFGSSVSDHEEMLNKIFKSKNPNYSQMCINGKLGEDYFSGPEDSGVKRYKKEIELLKNYDVAGQSFRPSAYDILSCLTKNDPGEIDEFSEEFGYTKISEAVKTYEAVKKEWQGMKELFTDEEIEKLQEIA